VHSIMCYIAIKKLQQQKLYFFAFS
jgi:hypothetical protein